MLVPSHMTPARAAAYLGCATVLGAWLASAAGIGEQSGSPSPEPQPVQSTGTETLAEDVQAQSIRLRDHLATAPTPQRPSRNPFAFAPRQAAERSAASRAAAPSPEPVVFPEPLLQLVGVAADQTAEGTVRTAIITAEGGEMLMVKAGDSLGARYKVESIGADTVELTDRTTGSIRRLTLR
jgi:hypothetical protein